MNTKTIKNNCISVAICCYNAAGYLDTLVKSIAAQRCPIPFEILIIDNNSTDNTLSIVETLSKEINVPIRYISESQQGIPFARNRAIEESINNRMLAFIDSDELPETTWLEYAYRGLNDLQADCVGGKIELRLPHRPSWLTDSLLPFLGQVDYSETPLEVVDRSTPIWSGNVAYRTEVFSDGLRFDTRYNRKGSGIGGGEDSIMFRELLAGKTRIRYEPKMSIIHLIPENKLKRSYFLKLHYLAGKKKGLFETRWEGKKLVGVPRFMFIQLLVKALGAIRLFIFGNQEYMREAMTAANLYGVMTGFATGSKEPSKL